MVELQWRCLFFLNWPFTVVFQHRHLFWRSKIAIAVLAQEPACSIFTPNVGRCSFSKGDDGQLAGGLPQAGNKAVWCVGDHFTDRSLFRLWEGLLHTMEQHWAQGQVSFGTTVGFYWL